MPVRLLALDLDGTLLNSRGEISARNRRAIDEARKEGVRVALVTGRRFRDARPLALELGLDVPVIAHNGALTKHARTLETVAVKLLPLAEAREVLSIGEAEGANALLSDDAEGAGVMLYDHLSDDNLAVMKYMAWSRRIHGEKEAAESVRHVPSLIAYLDHAPVHIGFSGNVAAIKSLSEALRHKLDGRVKILGTYYQKHDFALLDVLHPLASKGAGVAAAAAELGITRAEVMAVGDNHNDLEMLDYAAVSVVMGNAEPDLLNIAGFHVTATNDEDGVAEAIEKFILIRKTGDRRQKTE